VSGISIRRGGSADAAALAGFAARTFAEAFAAVTAPADMAAHLANSYTPALQAAELADPDIVTLLAERGERLVAYVQVRRNGETPPCVARDGSVEVQRFYVDDSVRGSGLAATLMRRSFGAVIELGGRHAWLGVWERNARAIAFYRKAGFVPVGSKVYVVGADPQIDHVMLASNIEARNQS